MSLEYFCCFHDYLAKTRNLSDSELGRLFRALMTYSTTGEKTQLNGREETAFDFISIAIDAAKERYNAKCAKLKANGETANATKCHQMPPNATQEKRKKKDTIPPTPLAGGEGVSSRFVPPTPQEVTAYCQERQNGIDGSEFCDFYASKGWMIGKTKMKDWRAAVRTWEKSRQKQPAAPQEDEWKGWH